MHFYNCRPGERLEADLDEIRRLKDDKTKLLIVTNPSTRAAATSAANTSRTLCGLAEELRLPLFSDEIYAGMVFKGKDPNATFTSVADFETTVPRVILGGTAKNLVVPGGGWDGCSTWIHTANGPSFLEGLKRVGMLVCGPCTVVQAALGEALLNTPQEHLDQMLPKSRKAPCTCTINW
ncbi:hypothetical protein TcBrA4_0069860 [Trypanosoma cruzi]|nr:hypothetical protein TcBrA4_0069860 [Trypanosoma cruzi]